MHPRHGVEKEYLAEVEGRADPALAARLRGGSSWTTAARAVRPTVRAESAGRGAVELVMAEGRKREVRRLLEAVGLPVRRLVRLRVGPVRLGRLRPATSASSRPPRCATCTRPPARRVLVPAR